MTGIIVSSACGVVSTAVCSLVTWFLSKKKYLGEVESTNIQNMQKSLEFYIQLANDTNARLASEIKEHNEEVRILKAENSALKQTLKEQENKFVSMIEDNRKEINLMKNQMLSVYGQVCLNFKCTERKLTDSTPVKTNKNKLQKENKNVALQ